MSKLIGIFEAFNAVDSIEDIMKICETTMSDAERASKQFGESSELKAIYDASKRDRELLEEPYNRLKKEYNELLAHLRNDEELLKELEKTEKVPFEYEKALAALKKELLSPKGYEKPEE